LLRSVSLHSAIFSKKAALFCAAFSGYQKHIPKAGTKKSYSCNGKHGSNSKTIIDNPAQRPAGQGQEIGR